MLHLFKNRTKHSYTISDIYSQENSNTDNNNSNKGINNDNRTVRSISLFRLSKAIIDFDAIRLVHTHTHVCIVLFVCMYACMYV